MWVTSGATPLRSTREYYENGTIDWYKTQELAGWYLPRAAERITELALKETSVKVFPSNTVLMAMYGDGKTITSLGILREPATSNQASCAMIVNPQRCDHRFLYYVLKHHRDDFIQIATGGAQRNLSTQLIRNFAIPLPPLPEQRHIAEILGALDDKIDLNRRMNETLEAIARAVFSSWFDEDANPSNRLAFSEVIDFQEGPGIMAVDFRAEGVPLIRLAGLIDGVSLLTGCNFLDPEMVARKWSNFALRCGDVLLSTSASLGRVATVTDEAAGAIAYTGIIRMRPRGDATVPEIIRMILLSRDFQEQVEAVGAGSVLRHFGPTHLKSMKVTMPEIAKQHAFAEVMRPMFAKQTANLRENATVASLRDTLLPKLLSGEIRVGAAEREVAEVV